MNIAIVTVAYALPDATRRLFESALSGLNPSTDLWFELFLHSQNPAVVKVCEELQARFEVDYHAYGENRGLARSWNEGLLNAYSKGADAVLIVNDDIEFAPRDVELLMSTALDHPECYAVTAMGMDLNLERRKDIAFSCFAINPIALERIGAFDEAFSPIYFEDVDYAYRALLLGLSKTCCPVTDLIHGGSSTLRNGHSPNHTETFLRNQDYYLRKWGGMPDHETYRTPFNDPETEPYMAFKGGV